MEAGKRSRMTKLFAIFLLIAAVMTVVSCNITDPDPVEWTNGDDMDPIVDRPPSPRGN